MSRVKILILAILFVVFGAVAAYSGSNALSQKDSEAMVPLILDYAADMGKRTLDGFGKFFEQPEEKRMPNDIKDLADYWRR
jgi:hypothetical protein